MKRLPSCGPLRRLWVALGLVLGLRRHDWRAAGTFMATMFPGAGRFMRLVKFGRWVLGQVFGAIPTAMASVRFAPSVSKTPIWLAAGNPLADYPWAQKPDTPLPAEVEVVVIGAGFTGAGCAYHWSRQQGGKMAVLEMDDPASGASGRNEGLVVMGRYYAMVVDTVRPYLDRVRQDLPPEKREQLAAQFAAAYARSAYQNGDLIERTVRKEGFDCDYARNGWIQARDEAEQEGLEASVRRGREAGFADWTTMAPEQVWEKGGMKVEQTAGFSRAAASFNPAKWVWCLLERALENESVHLFTRTRVLQVEDQDSHYVVHTPRGAMRCRFVINATESYTALLHRRYQELIFPVQTQAAFGEGGPASMKPDMGLSGKRGFFGRHGSGIMIGSDATRVPYHRAGSNNPSRFITKFLLGELLRYFERSSVHITHEWSGTPGFTVDEFPVVGLLDGKRQFIIGGMCGSGSAVSFNGARHVVQQILGLEGPDDYSAAYFAPTRLLEPERHPWPEVE